MSAQKSGHTAFAGVLGDPDSACMYIFSGRASVLAERLLVWESYGLQGIAADDLCYWEFRH